MKNRKKLIEVSLPLDAINTASAREKSIRHGHPSTLHLWWARRPLAAARAVIFAQMVDDPGSYVDELREDRVKRATAEKELKKRQAEYAAKQKLAKKAQVPEPEPTLDGVLAELERKRLSEIIEELVQWENTTNEAVLNKARAEIWCSWKRACKDNADHPRADELFNPAKLPGFHDPFAGGGALPLEAQRLGLEAYASDLNPVAVLINKAMIEIPPKFAGRPPVSLGARASRPHKGWHGRGYLQHCDSPGLLQSVTFRLEDAFPQDVVEALAEEADSPEKRERIEHLMDAGHGECWLRQPRLASLVEEALLHFDGERYRLVAWCIMPNHVHALIETQEGFPLDGVLHSWKSFTAKEINKALGRDGAVWQPDYYDRFIRDGKHLEATVSYIEEHPVKAGLVQAPEEWVYSSAAKHRMKEKEDASETLALPGAESWHGAQGLAEDVRYYGQWMRGEAEKRIGHLYPKAEITDELVRERPDLKPYLGRKLTVIAWLWARTVKSPNPAFKDVDVPLASTFMLSTKKGKEAYVEPVIVKAPQSALLGARASCPHNNNEDASETLALPGESVRETLAPPAYRFTVKVGKPKDPEAAKRGTKAGGSHSPFLCLLSGTPISFQYLRNEARAGRFGVRLMAVVAEGDRGRVYLPSTEEMEQAALDTKPDWKPDVEICHWPGRTNVVEYGLSTFGDLFTPRQLVALTTFSDLVQEARERVRQDALTAGLSDDDTPLRDGGTGALAYAEAVAVYLALGVDRLADRSSTICGWDIGYTKIRNTFGRQAIPMVWDYAEGNPFSESTGNFSSLLEWVNEYLAEAPTGIPGIAIQQDATNQCLSLSKLISSDPPYYDNIGYADLSDFFYVWLRRALKSIFPNLFATLAVPKAEELVATPYRHGTKAKAEKFFLNGMTQAIHCLAEQAHPGFPMTIYYAFKQSEKKGNEGSASTGWETFLEAVVHAGFALTGTWPMRTELGNRMISSGTNALASSIVLVCRRRDERAPLATRGQFITVLKRELPEALRVLQLDNVAPVDLAQAAIGPGMAVFSRHAKVIEPDGAPMRVRTALALINEVLDEFLAEQEGEFDADTRWALTWFQQHGMEEGPYGDAETLSTAKDTSVQGMVDAGFLNARAGKVRLLRRDEMNPDWNPTTDTRLTVWEITQHLIHAQAIGGEAAAARLVRQVGHFAEIARDLAYRLYTLCERKGWAQEAIAYNGLVIAWPEITGLAAKREVRSGEQMDVF